MLESSKKSRFVEIYVYITFIFVLYYANAINLFIAIGQLSTAHS